VRQITRDLIARDDVVPELGHQCRSRADRDNVVSDPDPWGYVMQILGSVFVRVSPLALRQSSVVADGVAVEDTDGSPLRA
jgi:hypothetical protein